MLSRLLKKKKPPPADPSPFLARLELKLGSTHPQFLRARRLLKNGELYVEGEAILLCSFCGSDCGQCDRTDIIGKYKL